MESDAVHGGYLFLVFKRAHGGYTDTSSYPLSIVNVRARLIVTTGVADVAVLLYYCL